MLQRTRILCLAIVLATCVSIAGGDKKEFEGSYRWNDGGSGALSAVFTPKGEGVWKVRFRFEFSGKRHTWKGTAQGDPTVDGRLIGTARWGKRDWEFEADVEAGEIRGRHTEITGGSRYETGTFVLTPPS